MNVLKRLFLPSPGKIGSKYCCICNKSVAQFHPYRGGWKDMPYLMTVLEIVGSDVDNFSCPSCGAHDRERHLFLYLDRLGLINSLKDATILHFAPEKRLAKIIESLAPVRYVKADLFPTDPSIEKIDILNIPYEAGSFDFIFANHILEHVTDDLRALYELERVLKHGGTAILQTPYSPKLKSTFSDPGIDNDLARLHVYGQEDHVRLYGADIFERFTLSGFQADIRTHADTLADVDSVRYGLNPREPLFLFRKV